MKRHLEQLLRMVVLLAALFALDVSAQDFKTWLDRMNRAVEELNYEGTFVRVLDGQAETLQIVHRYDIAADRVTEKISSLDGSGREILRDGDFVQCVLPDREVVLLEAPSSHSLALSLPYYSAALESHYEFKTFRKGQVARRDTQIVVISPLDEFRYGYILWLDSDTAMPLKSHVRDESGKLVEQMLFTDFELLDFVPDSSLESRINTEQFTWIRPSKHDKRAVAAVAWRASRLPDGFELTAARQSPMAGSGRPVDHLVYSDGLATVSVFVTDAETDLVDGYSRLGSTNAYSLTQRGYRITAMGGVPRQTVRRIAASLYNR
jgi:sigma-E factor negative regulatory protein RseB